MRTTFLRQQFNVSSKRKGNMTTVTQNIDKNGNKKNGNRNEKIVWMKTLLQKITTSLSKNISNSMNNDNTKNNNK